MTSRPALRFAGQAVHRCARTAPRGAEIATSGGSIVRQRCAEAILAGTPIREFVCGYPFAARRTLPLCTGVPKWCESEHESDPTAVDARHRPHRRDAILCTVRARLFAEFRVSVLRRRSVPGAGVRLVGLWRSTRPHNEADTIPARGVASRS